MAQSRPSEIKRVISELQEYGIRVYGPNIDLVNKIEKEGLMDWNAEQFLEYRKLKQKGEEFPLGH